MKKLGQVGTVGKDNSLLFVLRTQSKLEYKLFTWSPVGYTNILCNLLHVVCSMAEKAIKKKIGFSPLETKGALDTATFGKKDDD